MFQKMLQCGSNGGGGITGVTYPADLNTYKDSNIDHYVSSNSITVRNAKGKRLSIIFFSMISSANVSINNCTVNSITGGTILGTAVIPTEWEYSSYYFAISQTIVDVTQDTMVINTKRTTGGAYINIFEIT